MSQKPSYGIDAPKVIRNLLVIGVVLVIAGLTVPDTVHLSGVTLVHFGNTFFWPGLWFVITGLLMLLYALVGKFPHRDRMLALHAWRGDEQVLDVGTGRGLLLVGAAKKLISGHATGLDIWNTDDLSGNSAAKTEENLRIEGVAEKCTLISESAVQMPFSDASFDVILSNLCLHNIYDKTARRKACLEITRILKPGGTLILSDYKLTGEYARTFREAGLSVEKRAPNWLTTFPPLTILVCRKL